MTIDLLVDEEGIIVPGHSYFGWWGRLGRNGLPFIILPDGRVDFGGEGEEPSEERYGEVSLPKLRIERGRHFMYRETTGDYEMVISRLSDLTVTS